MNKKAYTICKISIAVILSILVSTAITMSSYIMALTSLITAMIVMYICKKNTKDILADERDYNLAGQSARYALFIYSLIGAVTVMILVPLGQKNQTLLELGNLIAYSVCFLMLLNALIFTILRKK